MSGNEVDVMEDRRAGLEAAFAPREESRNLPAVSAMQIEQVPLGAQKVAVMRDESVVLQRLKLFAAQAGDDFFYQWNTKNKDGTKGTIEGASISCALYVVRAYGNCDVDVRVQDIGSHWVFYARFTDFETGFRLQRAYQQRKNQSTGIKDADRQLDIVFQIGQSKAIRNVVCNALRPFTDYAFEEAKAGLVEKVGKRLDYYRGKVLDRFREMDVAIDRIEKVIGRTCDKWLARDIARVIAELQSVSDGMASVDDLWPPALAGADRPDRANYVEGQAAAEQRPAQAKPTEAQAKLAADETRQWLDDQITAAKAAAALPELEQIDDVVCKVLEREKRSEELRPIWNPIYAERKAALTAPQKTAAEIAEEQRKVEFNEWLTGAYADLDKCASTADVDALQDRIGNELAGDDALKKEWDKACNAQARAVMGGRRK